MKAVDPASWKMMEVSFPSGHGVKRWAKVCKDCGGNAGGCFSRPGLPKPAISPHAICPHCRSGNLELQEVKP